MDIQLLNSLSDREGELPLTAVQKSWNITNFRIRIVALFFALANLGETVALSTAKVTILNSALTLPLALVGTLWNATELIIVYIRRDKSKGVKVNAHLAIYCLLWVGGFTSTGYQTYNILHQESTTDFQMLYNEWMIVSSTLCAVTAFMSLAHFILFVRACIEVDRRKKDLRIQQLVIALNERAQQGRKDSPSSSRYPSYPAPPYPNFEQRTAHIHEDKNILAELSIAEPQELYVNLKQPVEPVELP